MASSRSLTLPQGSKTTGNDGINTSSVSVGFIFDVSRVLTVKKSFGNL